MKVKTNTYTGFHNSPLFTLLESLDRYDIIYNLKKHFNSLIFLLVFAFLPLSAALYVDKNHPSASNNNPGTEFLPFLDIQTGVNIAKPGDTVIIKGDLDSNTAATYSIKGNGITTIRNGTDSDRIIITAYTGHIVVLQGDSTGYGIALNNSYIGFFGLIFKGFTQATEGSAVKSGITIDGCEFAYTTQTGLRLRNITDLIIRHTLVHHCFESGISMRGCNNVLLEGVDSWYNDDGNGASGDADGFHSLDGDSIDFINCTAIGNTEDGFDIASNSTLINCVSANHNACNIKLWRRDGDQYAPKTMFLINCLVYGAKQCGIKATNGPSVRLFCSVIYGNGEEGVAFRAVTGEAGPPIIESFLVNTIIAANDNPANWARPIDVAQAGINKNRVYGNYNCYHGYPNQNNGLHSDDNPVTSNPIMVNANQNDFHLDSTSPCIDSGITPEQFAALYSTLGIDITKDFDSNSRPINEVFDIGAFEYGSTAILPQKKSILQKTCSFKVQPDHTNRHITFFLRHTPGNKSIEIYQASGSMVKTITSNATVITWNRSNTQGKKVSNGIYIVRVITKYWRLEHTFVLR